MKIFLILSCIIFFNISNAIEVNVTDNTFYVNGKPYYMKGICYHPVPKGKIRRDFSNLNTDLALMKEAGINTIRVYEPIDDINVLNTLDDAGIKVVINFGYNQRGR